MKKTAKKKKIKSKNNQKISLITVSLILFLVLFLLINQIKKPQNIIERAQTKPVCPKISISAYFSPGTLWNQAISFAPTVGIMKANNANGPGGKNVSLLSSINKAKSKGIRVLGYVDTSYTRKGTTTVESDVNLWRTEYGVTDIFFDQATNDAGHVGYYKILSDYVHGKTPGSIVAINPGTSTVEGYASVVDLIEIFESPYASYINSNPPNWVYKYPSSKFLNVVHTTPNEADMLKAVSLAKQRNVGYLYITDDVEPNPYDTLPTYLAQEVAAVNSGCSKAVNPQPTSKTPSPSSPAPTFVCLGACPTASVSQMPTAIPAISSTPVHPGQKPAPSNNSNLLANILQLIINLLNLILHLFGR